MKKIIKKLFFTVIGLLSLIWFLVRVIPKPSRATYPCMRVASPIASSFVIYLIGLFSSMLVFKRAKKYLYQSRYILFSIALLIGLTLGISTLLKTDQKAYAKYRSPLLEGPNQPMGEGKGINPGRVVWIWNPDATDGTCANTSGDYWYEEDNTNQVVVDSMLSQSLRMLTGEESDSAAWEAIFRYYNENHGKGNVGYTSGEKIVIKINLNGGVSYNSNKIDATPQMVYAILNQLINAAGVAQADISIGDPGRNISNLYWDKCHSVFPNVHYWGTNTGRTPIVPSDTFEMFTSDGNLQDYLPQCYMEADYMINIPVFKKHHRAGISLSSKNHFGTFVPFNGAAVWHYSLPSTQGKGVVDNGEYGVYRCFVDIMGHEHLGGKTILYIIDGIWGSTNWAHRPIKWRMAPFNNDWPSSIFVSQDPVAIESVGFDFLYNEFDEDHPTEGTPGEQSGPFPRYAGVDDFLHQAADSANWTDSVPYYDPEGDGIPIPWSLGTHEHWNDATKMQYSRNLGEDEGIELVSNYTPGGIEEDNDSAKNVNGFTLYQNYPNPFKSSTTIRFAITSTEFVTLEIYNLSGQKIETLVSKKLTRGIYSIEWTPKDLASGNYFYHLEAGKFTETNKLSLMK